jgi:uncharacterized protein YndB with AHSA1/START domain
MGGRQRQYDSRVSINAPKELVFQFLTDPESIRKWAGGSAEIQPLTEGGHRQAARSRIAMNLNGRALDIESEVVESTPTDRLITALTSRQMNARSDFQLEQTNGRTDLVHSLVIWPRGWARIFAPFSGQQIQTGLDQGLENLRQFIELEARQLQQSAAPIE